MESFLMSTLLKSERTMSTTLQLQVNQFTAFDNLIQLGQSVVYEFFRINGLVTEEKFPSSHSNPNLVMRAAIQLNQIGMEHCRIKYDILGLLGDVGGVLGFVLPILSLLISPISEHSFTLQAAHKLFFARDKKGVEIPKTAIFCKNLNCTKFDKFLESGLLSHTEEEEISYHWPIHITPYRSFRLFCSRFEGILCCINSNNCEWYGRKRL